MVGGVMELDLHGMNTYQAQIAVDAALLEHLIDQRGLAVVNVRDDCNIPNFILRHTWRPFLLCLKVSYIKISQKRILTQTYWKYKIFL